VIRWHASSFRALSAIGCLAEFEPDVADFYGHYKETKEYQQAKGKTGRITWP